MTSIPVPALEAPPDEPSGTKIGAVVIAFALGTAVSIGLGRPPSTNERLRRVRAAARTVGPWGQHRRVSSGAAAKAALASVVLAPTLQAVTAMGLYGRSGGPGLGPCTAGRGAWRS